ncbi:MAG TPA: tetraacyldisaccharide 4'-kinase [Gemmatimonadaceae bacterium]
MTIERVWYGDRLSARVVRAVLAPASWMYGAASAARNALYDRGVFGVQTPAVPVLSIGNVSVGGTGKTPMTAWAAERLRRVGARPAIVLRGYGDDEPLVHRRLNPDVNVVVDADRVRGVLAAQAAGADCVILDDGFQHRAIARHADWVLVPAEHAMNGNRLLPAGPLREPLSALRRADVLVVTRKVASHDQAMGIARQLASHLRTEATAVCLLAPDGLVDATTGQHAPLSWLDGRRVVAAAAIGAPDAFFAQLRAVGARLDEQSFSDHHAFDARDVARLVRRAAGTDAVVCTLKDAVKLAPLWPRIGPSLWYVSQRAVVEHGERTLDASLAIVLAARQVASPTAGSPA